MPRRFLALAAVAASCASAPPPRPKPPPAPAHPSGVVVGVYDPNAVETVVPAVDRVPRHFEEEQPPPPRRHHERLITAREFKRLVRAHPLGFGPDDCVELCGDPDAYEASGRWTWVLRCQLSKNVVGRPAVACHQEAVGEAELERIHARWSGASR